VETIGSKRSYALIWCMPNNDDDDAVVSNNGSLLTMHRTNELLTLTPVR